MAYLSLLVPVLLLALFLRGGDSVRCWTCTSDLNPLCNDPFVDGQSSNMVDCDAKAANYPFLRSAKSLCKKQIKDVDGVQIITRGCTWKSHGDYTTTCPNTSSDTTYCETCDSHGCNGASFNHWRDSSLTEPTEKTYKASSI